MDFPIGKLRNLQECAFYYAHTSLGYCKLKFVAIELGLLLAGKC